MSSQGVEEVLDRLLQEPAFRDQLKANPAVLDQYDLTAEERQALASWDREAVMGTGVDERVTRRFVKKDEEPD